MFDIDHFTAVINPPESGIVAIGSIAAQAVAEGDRVVVRRRMRATMSCDHRVIDGATGAAYMRTLKQMLENRWQCCCNCGLRIADWCEAHRENPQSTIRIRNPQ